MEARVFDAMGSTVVMLEDGGGGSRTMAVPLGSVTAEDVEADPQGWWERAGEFERASIEEAEERALPHASASELESALAELGDAQAASQEGLAGVLDALAELGDMVAALAGGAGQ